MPLMRFLSRLSKRESFQGLILHLKRLCFWNDVLRFTYQTKKLKSQDNLIVIGTLHIVGKVDVVMLNIGVEYMF